MVDKILDVLTISPDAMTPEQQKCCLLALTNPNFLKQADTAVNKNTNGIIDANDIQRLVKGVDERSQNADSHQTVRPADSPVR